MEVSTGIFSSYWFSPIMNQSDPCLPSLMYIKHTVQRFDIDSKRHSSHCRLNSVQEVRKLNK